jgi:tetratricopeptide (TPR) repeat protein
LRAELELPEGSPSGRVPGHLRRLLARGLSPAPADRFPSMDALVEELEFDPFARRGRWLTLAGVSVVALVSALLWADARRDAPLDCDARPRLAGVWDETVREQVHEVFRTSGLAHAPETFSRLEHVLDDYAEGWVGARSAGCEATRTAGGESDALAARQICLDAALRDLTQLTQLLAEADATVIENALQAARTLPDLDACDHARTPDDGEVPPERLAELELALARAKTLRAAGKYSEGRELAEEVRSDASAIGATRVERVAILWVGRLLDDGGDPEAAQATLLEAIAAADRAGDDEIAIESVLELVFVQGVSLARPDEGLRWAKVAEGRIARAGTQGNQAKLRNHMGLLLKDTGDRDRAVEMLERAIDLRTAVGDRSLVASSLNNLGIVELERENLERARELFQRSLDLTIEESGPEHPDVASPLGNLAAADLRLGALDEAEQELERTRRIQLSTFGTDHPRIAMTEHTLGSLHQRRGDHERALQSFERAIALSDKLLGADHPLTATAHASAGEAAVALGRTELARTHLEAALAPLVRTAGEGSDQVRTVRETLAGLPPAQTGP